MDGGNIMTDKKLEAIAAIEKKKDLVAEVGEPFHSIRIFQKCGMRVT